MNKFLLIFLSIILFGCASLPGSDSKYADTSDHRLCFAYLAYPDINVWQKVRRNEILKRNLDCSPYKEEARLYRLEKGTVDGYGQVISAVGELAGKIADDMEEERDKKNAWTAAMRAKADNEIRNESYDCGWTGNPGYENLTCKGSSGTKLRCNMVGPQGYEKLRCK